MGNTCANMGSGTSFATPVAAGVVALMLESNPSLGWRDVQEILARTAQKTDPQHEDWTKNAAGLNINHWFNICFHQKILF